VVIRSGLWEAEETLRYIRPCYPLDVVQPPLALVRSTWFVEAPASGVVSVGSRKSGDLLPLGEALCRQLDASAATSQPGAGRPAVRIGGPGLPAELRVFFITDTEAWLAQDNLASRVADAILNSTRDATSSASRAVPPVAGALRLRRGFNVALAAPLGDDETADAQAASSGPVTHLVLSTHGIGHGLEFVNTATTAASLRSMLRAAPQAAGCVPGGRLMLLPVQWRKGLALTSDTGALDALVPDAASAAPLRGLRVVLNFLVCDVLSYVASDGDRMAEALVCALNDVVARFRARNPTFGGPISVVAHSLGSVLMFDLMRQMGKQKLNARSSGSSPPRPGTPSSASSPAASPGDGPHGASSSFDVAALMAENAALRAALDAPAQHAPKCRSTLSFDVDTLVMLGSPLGLFLALRGQSGTLATKPGATASTLACRRLVNVLHPFDPVAYRVEPLAWPQAMMTTGLASGSTALGPPAKAADVPSARGAAPTAASRRVAAEAAATLRGVGAMGLTSALKGRVNAMAAAVITGQAQSAGGASGASAQPQVSDDEAAQAHVHACDTLKLLSGNGVDAAAYVDSFNGNGSASPTAGGGGGVDSSIAGRIDFLIAAADTNPLTAFLSAHSSYWSCPDTALFIMRACGPPMQPQSPTQALV